MSLKRLTLSRKKTSEQAQEEVLSLLGLARHQANPLDLPVMYEISTWNLEDLPAQAPSELPHTFLHRLWLLSPQARSPLCQITADSLSSNPGGDGGQCAVNPQDLVTAVYMSANNFLRQEMTVRMAQCGFAVPLLLPPSRYGGLVTLLVWPLRSVVRTWRPQSLADPDGFIKGDIASSNMPLLSFVRLGRCSISKSLVMNHILGGFRGPASCFLHRAMDGGQLPRRLSNGLVEIGWYLPSGDRDLDLFHEPVMVANLRGDAATSTGEFDAQLSFLCRNSSAIFMFCESLGKQERLQLASFRDSGCRVYLIIYSEKNGLKEKEGRKLWKQEAALEKLAEDLELPERAVMSYSMPDGEEELANTLSETVARLLRDSLQHMNLVEAAATAYELGIATDEGEACQIALAFEEEVLEGIDAQGASEYKEEQLPLQGQLWKSWVQENKEECRQKNSIKSAQMQLDTMSEIESFCSGTRAYNMTEAMRTFTAALLTPDIVRRAFFLNWMRLKLNAMAWQSQPIKQRSAASSTWELDEITGDLTKISTEDLKQLQFPLCLENFTREMGLIFETSIFSPGSGSDGLLSFPAVAADLLLRPPF
ncbi:hypothetical protein GJAV_G00051810 [Gymnothorax javanicus]|nr:hypothetical protein GJAV_G00051810 [Gymnothorax javanicus]